MSSEVGLAMLRDVLTASSGEVPVPCRCAALIANQIAVIVDRGVARRQAVPEVDAVMDGVVAPIVYRLLFGAVPPTHEMTRRFWVGTALTLPVFALEMGGHLTNLNHLVGQQLSNWIQLLLGTPVVLWAGWPFFVRCVASIRNRSPNMILGPEPRRTSW